MRNELQAEIDAFHKKIRARALIIMIEWAGSARALSELAGLDKYTGTKWAQRGAISAPGALRLTRVRGCPLSFSEMVPGEDIGLYKSRACPKCGKALGISEIRPGSLPLLKAGRRRNKRKRLQNIAKRKTKKSQAPIVSNDNLDLV